MKHSVLGKVVALLLITGTAFALPAYAEKYGRPDMGMGESGAQQMSGMMNDMSSEMKDMSGMIEGGSMNPDAMKKMSSQMKQMGGMMNNMSGMTGKGMTMDAGMQKTMSQMRKDMPASPAMK